MSEETIVIICLIIGNFVLNAFLYESYHNDFKRLVSMLGRRKFALIFLSFGWLLLGVTLIVLLCGCVFFVLARSLYTVFSHIFSKEKEE